MDKRISVKTWRTEGIHMSFFISMISDNMIKAYLSSLVGSPEVSELHYEA